MPRKPRRSPEESYRVRKQNDLLRNRDPNWSLWIDGDDYQKFRQHILDLHEYITYADMARMAGVPDSSIYTHVQRGGRAHERVHRKTYTAVMNLHLTEEEKITRYDRRRGAHRIIQGLIARGFNHQAIAEVVGSNRQSVANLACKHSKSWDGVSPELYSNFLLAADKLETADPLDYGCSPVGISINLTTSRRKGWATIGAWDLETIHREDAYPEWTGACGTLEGYRIHLREEIPLCTPCSNVCESRTGEAYNATFSASKLRAVMEEKGFTVSSLAEAIGYSRDVVRRITWSQRNPQPKHIKAMTKALGVSPAAVTVDGVDDVIYDDDFDGARMKLLMEERGIGYHRLGKDTGFSHTSFHKWVNGTTVPRIPNVQKVAKSLGVDWKVFYKCSS